MTPIPGFTGQILEFIGFDPTESTVSKALEKLGRVIGESPSDAAATATVTKTIAGFEGRVTIRSSAGSFVADAMEDDPVTAIQRLSVKIRSQLRIWKRNRSFD